MGLPSNLIDISLFPIPGSVAMPFSVVPLHIFEPRYRKMITESIEAKRRIGVCHTKRQISPSKKTSPNINLQDFLKSNQESYEPHTIFSAGLAQILETLEDGRMVVQITIDGRYEIRDTIQEVPYKIVSCMSYEDIDHESSQALRADLDLELLGLSEANQNTLTSYLKGPEWKGLSNEEYSFAIYSLIQIDPDMLQIVLELQSVNARIRFLRDLLTKNYLM